MRYMTYLVCDGIGIRSIRLVSKEKPWWLENGETPKRTVDADLQHGAGVGKRFLKRCACVGIEPWRKGSKPC